MFKYSRDQFWKIYEKLPSDLKEAVLSAENADYISEISERNRLEQTKISDLALLVGNTLLGLVPPSELQSSLEKELGLEKSVAKKISQEINRFVFFPVKESLASLYKMPSAEPPPSTQVEAKAQSPTTPASPDNQPLPVPKKPKQTRPDSYREVIE